MAKKPNASDKLMAEKINYGGEIKTRAAVVREMKAEGHSSKAIDRFAFGTPALTERELENYRKNTEHVKKSGTTRSGAYGKKTGPTGRKRNHYNVGAWSRKNKNLALHEKSTHPNLEAYGQEGVREAKQSVHKRHPHTWVKFNVYNYTKNRRVKS